MDLRVFFPCGRVEGRRSGGSGVIVTREVPVFRGFGILRGKEDDVVGGCDRRTIGLGVRGMRMKGEGYFYVNFHCMWGIDE